MASREEQEKLNKLMNAGWSWRDFGAGGGGTEETAYILEDETGHQVYAALVSEETIVDATPNDIRAGVTAITESGITVGEKEIPAYHVTEGVELVIAGREFRIRIPERDRYQYTKLQAILCPFNSTPDKSVSADKVCINDNIYAAGETISLATVTLDHDTKEVVLGIVNDTDSIFVIRYFSYKEEP